MIRLVQTLRGFGDCIEADFQIIYGLPLWQVLAGGEWARVHRLILQLGDDSKYAVAAARLAPAGGKGGPGPDISEWERTDRLLASVVDELAIANWQRSGGKGKKPVLLTAPKRKRVRNDLSAFKQSDVIAALKARGPQPKES